MCVCACVCEDRERVRQLSVKATHTIDDFGYMCYQFMSFTMADEISQNLAVIRVILYFFNTLKLRSIYLNGVLSATWDVLLK